MVLVRKIKRKDSGLTLLEYCAGAAVLAAAVFLAFNTLGSRLNTTMKNVGDWAVTRSEGIEGNAGNGN